MKGIVSSGTRRSPALPDVPTCTEASLQGFCGSAWHAVLVPVRTPKALIAKLHQTLSETLRNAELREQLLAREDADTIASTPEELARILRSESLLWGKIIKAVGIKGE